MVIAYLLEEHQARTDECTPPTTTLEQIDPANKLKLNPVANCTLLQVRVPLNADLSMQSNLSADVKPLALDPVVRRWELT
jgi:hypothetical protein